MANEKTNNINEDEFICYMCENTFHISEMAADNIRGDYDVCVKCGEKLDREIYRD
jgi:predicted SprT family Zn-dependent metalloprotease